jgi:hypothetical protein
MAPTTTNATNSRSVGVGGDANFMGIARKAVKF